MMKLWILASLVLILSLFGTAGGTSAQANPPVRNCIKSFNFTGIDAEGNEKTVSFPTTKHFTEFTAEFLAGVEAQDAATYGDNYAQTGPATWKINCAGLVMDRLWGTGDTWVYAPDFYTQVMQPFAQRVEGTAKKGDVVAFFKGETVTHVAIVTEDATSADSVVIESKDGQESTRQGTLTLSNEADVLIVNRGTPVIFRFPSTFRVEPVTTTECDDPALATVSPEFTGIQADTVFVSNESPDHVQTDFVSTVGKTYIIEASGEVSDWAGLHDGVDPVWCYAVWRCGEQGEVWLQLRIDDKGMNDYVTTPLPYNPAHLYVIEIPGTGKPFTFHTYDSQNSAGDNEGFFVVDVYEK